MNVWKAGIERRLQISGALIALGLVVELVSLLWSHPTAFLLFLLLGGSLMCAGIVIYLTSLVVHAPSVGGGDQTPATGAGVRAGGE